MSTNIDKNKDEFQELQAQWASVRGKIRRKIGDALFKSWFKPLSLVSYDSGVIVLSVSNSFQRTRLIEEYHDLIKSQWKEQNSKIKSIEIKLVKNNREIINKKADGPTLNSNKIKTNISPKISADLDKRFTFTNFIVGKPNELAFAAAIRVAESQKVPFNPLFLYGGVGRGDKKKKS